MNYIPSINCDMDFLMSFWRQFGWKWDQIRWKSHHFLSKCHGHSMTWTCAKSLSCLGMENKKNWINDMESSRNLVSIWTKPPPSRFVTWNDMGFPRESLSHFSQGLDFLLQTNTLESFQRLRLKVKDAARPCQWTELKHNKRPRQQSQR